MSKPASATDRHLRRELLLLRAELQRQELKGAAEAVRNSLEPALRAGSFLLGLAQTAPVRSGLNWIREYPVAGSLVSLLVARLGGLATRRLMTGGLIRIGTLVFGGAAAVAVSLVAARWWQRSRRS